MPTNEPIPIEGDSTSTTHDGKWPLAARALVAFLLVPVFCATTLVAENDFSSVGNWFDPLVGGLMILTVLVTWTVTGHSQR